MFHVLLTAGGLDEVRHGEALVQQAELAALVLAVGRVEEDAAVQERAVDIRDHAVEG